MVTLSQGQVVYQLILWVVVVQVQQQAVAARVDRPVCWSALHRSLRVIQRQLIKPQQVGKKNVLWPKKVQWFDGSKFELQTKMN